MFKTLARALAAFLALQPALAAAQSAPATLPYHSVYGRIGATPGDTGPGQAIPFLNLKQAMGITTDTVATLKAMVVPTSRTCVYLLGYSSPGDGGEGEVCYNTSSSAADDGGTTFIPNSAPAAGRWQRQRQSSNGAIISVRWFGAQCGAATATNTAAFVKAGAVAQAYKSILYFPGCSTGLFYSGNIALVNTSVSLLGDGLNSFIVGALNTTTVDLSSNVGCGGVHDFTVRGVYIGASGASGIGLHIANAGWLNIQDIRVDGPTAVKIECASQFNITNTQGYSSSGPALQIIAGGSNSAPGTVSGGQFSAPAGGPSCAIDIVEPLGLLFTGVNYSVALGTQAASICVNGGGGSSVGSVTFKEMHSESNFNLSSTAADYAIGCNAKAGSVKIEGGSAWGLGDLSHSQQDFVRLCDARNVEVSNVLVSKLGGTGYTRSMIRVENTYTGTYTFTGNVADINGTLYSDATGKLTGQTGDASNINQSFGTAFSLSGTLTPAALSGDVNDYNPTGQSSATVLRIDGGASSRNITGLAGGLDGRLLTVVNVGTANPLIVKNESASSTAANRMTVGLDITVDVNKSLTLRYDGTSARWRPWDSIYSSVSVPISRIISTTSPITGGGDLSIDRTFACATCVTSSGGGAITGTAPIAASAAGAISLNAAGVTYAKIQDLGALAIMGRSANTSGVGADIQATAASGGVLRESGSTIGFGTVATAGIANNAVDNTKIRQGVARSVVGVAGNATANVADIQGTASQFLGINGAGTALAFQTMSQDCTLAAGVITCTKTNNVSFAASATTDTTTQANVAFTGLSAAAAAADADTLPVNQGAGNLKQTFAAIKTWIKSWIAKADVGLGSVPNTDMTNLSNAASGTVAAARGGAGTITGALKGNGSGVVSQAACADLSNASVYCSATQGQLPGIASNTAATAGNIGETVDGTVALGSPVSLSTGAAANVTSISLTAGNWEVTSTCYFLPAGSTTATLMQCGPNTTTGTVDVTVGNFGEIVTNGQVIGGNVLSASPGQSKTYLVNATTTVFLVASATFATSTMTVAGKIHAVRTR